ncbi:ArsR/SmtB family transcription factor [Sediminitomix flava]|uniref:ArsR family transcriptional regulator n=1 Tax=Sediminitomix flava TaxID=379075 RepID=A0A315ZB82_SEDFL|nr:metalloregulator ArsR/SmtB family transcription factor [Sediminitomix flava]PWJ42552.1 ArsR family transcriptional regulator [Sediminitomix flava]
MGITKSEYFTDKQNELASVLKVLGHPARIAILEHLITSKQCICGDLVETMPLAQPTISQHLKELKNAGIIQSKLNGGSAYYCINEEKWDEIKSVFNLFMDQYNDCNCELPNK